MDERIALWFLTRWQVGRRPILILGHGRSGTSWVGDIFAAARRALYYFEPCSPDISGKGDFDMWFRYLRCGARDELFEQALDAAFRGLPFPGQRWNRARWHRLLPGYRIVVKEVAAFMAAEWLHARYKPEMLIIIRHPCAVVLSELGQGTPPEDSMREMLGQPELFEDHLNPYRSMMEKASTPFEILGAMWGARHRVLANNLSRHAEWQVVFYKDLCANPVAEFQRLFRHFGLLWTKAMEQYVIERSTGHTSGLYSVRRNSVQQIDKWKQSMTSADVNAVRHYVEPFDLPFYRSDADWALDVVDSRNMC